MNQTNAQPRAIVLGALIKIDAGNINAGWTEGVVQVIKKVQRPDGTTHPYVSGQALRRYIRDTVYELIVIDPHRGQRSPEERTSDVKAPVITEGNPRKYVDDDVFGFMRAIKREGNSATTSKEGGDGRGPTRKRESPLRVSPAYGLFPYSGDRDLGTRSAVEATGEAEAGGSIFETELTNNVFRTTMLLELDRVGVWKGFETTDKDDRNGGALDQGERKRRIMLLLEALKYLWGGGRRSRMLVELVPQFIIYARLAKKVPIFLNSLSVDMHEGKYRLDIRPLKEVLSDYRQDIQRLIIGVRSGFITNSIQELSDLAPNISASVVSVGEAIDLMIADIDSINLPSG